MNVARTGTGLGDQGEEHQEGSDHTHHAKRDDGQDDLAGEAMLSSSAAAPISQSGLEAKLHSPSERQKSERTPCVRATTPYSSRS